jgi:hypothetical protein
VIDAWEDKAPTFPTHPNDIVGKWRPKDRVVANHQAPQKSQKPPHGERTVESGLVAKTAL